MTTIGFIGSGHIGSTVAQLAVDAGYDVVLSNSRGPETLADLVEKLGPHARAATSAEAAAAGDLVVLTIPLGKLDRVPAGPLAGKVVIDTCNYYPQRDGQIAALDEGETTTSGLVQRHLPDAHVVKAFNNIYFEHLGSMQRPAGAPDRSTLLIAGDDADAKQTVIDVMDALGYDTLDSGSLAESWRFQRDQPAYAGAYTRDGDFAHPRPADAEHLQALLDQGDPNLRVIRRTVATAAGGTVAYEADDVDENGPAGSPLLLLAGQANNRSWWDRSRPDFVAAGLRTIVLDWRGTGGSTVSPVPFTTADLADDAVAVLDDLGVAQAHVYGTSMGGRVAQWLAIDHADRLDALVLGCTSPGGSAGVERSQAIRRLLAQAGPEESARLLADLMYTPGWQRDHPGPYPTVGDPTLTATAARQHLRASAQHDAYEQLAGIEARTLVLHGTDDELSPVANAHVLARQIPDCSIELFAGGRHAYFDEVRPRSSRAVVDFVAG